MSYPYPDRERRALLMRHLTLARLKTMVMDLAASPAVDGVGYRLDYEDIAREGLEGKLLGLWEWCERRGLQKQYWELFQPILDQASAPPRVPTRDDLRALAGRIDTLDALEDEIQDFRYALEDAGHRGERPSLRRLAGETVEAKLAELWAWAWARNLGQDWWEFFGPMLAQAGHSAGGALSAPQKPARGPTGPGIDLLLGADEDS